jgi:uncharacterized protein (TIGR02099 family)
VTSRGTRAWRWLAGTVAVVAIFSALGVGAFRLALELLPEYEARVAEMIRSATGLRLSFDSLDARIGLHGPEIYFAGARIVDPQGDVLVTAREGRASLSVLRSAWFRRLEISRVILESPRLHLVIFPDRHVELVGPAGFARPGAPRHESRGLDRVPRGIIAVRDATLVFLDLRAGHATWELTQADIELRRQGDSIAMEGKVSLPEHLGQSVEFDADVAGNLADLDSLDWRVRIAARDVDFAGWEDVLPESFSVPAAGSGSLRVSARGAGRRLDRGRVDMQLTGVELPHRDGRTPVIYSRLGGDLVVERLGDDWHVAGRELEFSLPGARWTPADLEASATLQQQRIKALAVRTSYFRPENLMPLLALAPPSSVRDRIEQLAPRGILRNVDLTVVPVGPRLMPDITGRAAFEDLGFAPFGRFPGLSGLDGSFTGGGATAVINLAAIGVEMDWPAKWRSVVAFSSVRAGVEVSRAAGGVRVSSDDAVVEAAHGRAAGRVRVLARPGETTLMDIEAHASVSDLSAFPAYLPKDRLSPKSLDWLDAAFPAGRVDSAHVVITGPVQGFPYREGQGRFHVVAEAEGVTLNYAPGWLPVTGLAATAEFDGPSMKVTARSASIGDIAIGGAVAEVTDWLDSYLLVRAEAAADVGKVHGFFAASPLADSLGATFARLSGSGPVHGEFVMYLPIKQFAQRVFTVRGQADGVELALAGFGETLKGIRGEFWVRNREFYAPSLTLDFLGGPAEARISSRLAENGDIATSLEAHGTLEGGRLPDVVRLPLTAGLAGATGWRGRWDLQRPADPSVPWSSHIRLDSDLSGLASALPAPFAKHPEERRPFRLELEFGGDATVLASAGLGPDAAALVELRRRERGLELSRGIVRFGGGEVKSLPVGPGLRIDGRLPYLSITDLTSLRWRQPAQRPLEDFLSAVQLDVGRLEVLGYEFEDVSGRMRTGNRAWDVDVAADSVRGSLQIPYRFPGEAPLVADLDLLHVSPAVEKGDGEADPRRLPGMRIDIRDLVFLDWRLGHLSARLEHESAGIKVESFSIQQPAFDASGTGAWRVTPAGQLSSLQLEVASRDVKSMLESLALAPVIEASKGTIEADVSWPRGPDAKILERISGKAKIVLSQGRMLSLEPGAGRILGLMSLSHIGKRLSLDFEDLTGQGMAFDSVKGDFALASGEAFTDNLTLRGSAAEVGIAGRTSLKDRTYDQTAVVTGDLGASLGVAGVLAGGPAVGAALLLFSQIFKEPLKGVARGYYRITGPWEDPIVKKIDAHELEEAAAQVMTAPAGGPQVRENR